MQALIDLGIPLDGIPLTYHRVFQADGYDYYPLLPEFAGHQVESTVAKM